MVTKVSKVFRAKLRKIVAAASLSLLAGPEYPGAQGIANATHDGPAAFGYFSLVNA